MCMPKEELKALKDEPLLAMFKRALELKTENRSNGKFPFDEKQLEEEILLRLARKNEKTLTPGESYDLHDELS